MARPSKNNLDYFSHDSEMRNDVKIKSLRRKHSHKGYSAYVMMLEHLANCEYFQYEWTDLNIELIASDFDLDTQEFLAIIDYAVKLDLLQIQEGFLTCGNLYSRNYHILEKRSAFNLDESPIEKAKSLRNINTTSTEFQDSLRNINSVNSTLTQFPESFPDINTHSIVKESIEDNSKVQNRTVQDSRLEDRIEEETTENNSIPISYKDLLLLAGSDKNKKIQMYNDIILLPKKTDGQLLFAEQVRTQLLTIN